MILLFFDQDKNLNGELEIMLKEIGKLEQKMRSFKDDFFVKNKYLKELEKEVIVRNMILIYNNCLGRILYIFQLLNIMNIMYKYYFSVIEVLCFLFVLDQKFEI